MTGIEIAALIGIMFGSGGMGFVLASHLIDRAREKDALTAIKVYERMEEIEARAKVVVAAPLEFAPGMTILGFSFYEVREIINAMRTYIIPVDNLRDELKWNYHNRPRPTLKTKKKEKKK